MKQEDQIQTIYNFLEKEHLCVISTVSPDDTPQSAVMAFSQTMDLDIIFQTPNTTRKYNNLKSNKSISIATGWSLDEFITVQYDGIAEEATQEELDEIRQIHISKNEASKKYAYIEENKFFRVKPKLIKYSDIKNNIYFEVRY